MLRYAQKLVANFVFLMLGAWKVETVSLSKLFCWKELHIAAENKNSKAG